MKLLARKKQKAAKQLLDWALAEWRPQVNVFDTFSACAFARFWMMAQRDPTGSEDAETLRVAAALLAGVDGMASDTAFKILQERAAAETQAIALTQIVRTLGKNQLARKDYAGAEQSFAGLFDKYHSREEVAYGYAMALLRQNKNTLLQQQLDRLTAGKPTLGVQRARAELAAEQGQFAEASSMLRKSINPRHRFRARFYEFFHEGEGEQTSQEPISIAPPAKLDRRGRHSEVAAYSHAAYQGAQEGQPGKTLELLGLSLQASGQRRIDDRLFTVFGRLAESLGMPDVAREYYERAAKLAQPGKIDFAQLAKVRLQQLATP